MVVTGAAHGLGLAMTRGFVREGARVAAIDVDAAALEAALDGVDGEGSTLAVAADVRSWDDVRSAIAKARRAHGSVDVLVNNAGVKQLTVAGDERPAWAVPVATWDTVVETNLRGPFLCCRAVLPAMLDRGAGRVINVTSGHGQSARARRAPYVASKFGLEGFHESLALELEDTGVSSVALRPPDGGIYTERRGELGRSPEEFRHRSPDVIREAAVRLAAGEGENGGRYQVTQDGEGYVEYERA